MAGARLPRTWGTRHLGLECVCLTNAQVRLVQQPLPYGETGRLANPENVVRHQEERLTAKVRARAGDQVPQDSAEVS